MHFHRLGQCVRLTVAVCTALAFVCACSSASTKATGSGTVFGPSQPLGNGTVKTYVTLDDAGQPTEVGLRLTPAAMDGLPQDTGPANLVMLAFPDEAAGTAFNHVMLNWNPQGHDPIALFAVGTRAFLEGAWEQRRIVALLDGDGPPGFKVIRQQRDREWVRRNAKLLHAEEHHRAVRVRVVVLTTMIGGAAREVAHCRNQTEASETVDEVCRIVAQLAAPPE